MMESLLCNEVWLMMSSSVEHANEVHCNVNDSHHSTISLYSSMEDCVQAFVIFLGKEETYMPEPGYMKHITENCLIGSVRLKAIQWFIKSQRRFNLSLETVFCAANYLDRFNSLRKCRVWNDWMFELLSVACLSIASKFNETNPPNLNEIQMEGLKHCFELHLIQRMELILLKALEWRLGPTTAYSYIELLTWCNIGPLNKHLVEEFTARVTEILVKILLDSKFLEFRPCVIAMCAVQHISREFLSTANDSLCTHFTSLIPSDQKDDLIECCKMMMDEKLVDECSILTPAKEINCFNCPSRPVTVLATYCSYDFCDCQVDLSLLRMKSVDSKYFGRSKKKRKRDQEGCGVVSEIIWSDFKSEERI